MAVAAQLLEDELGYTVETVDIDENAQWAAINTGEIDGSLEVWPSGHAGNRADFIDSADGNVDDAGLLGPVGKIGWFMPTYMVDQYPALATWEGLADPELAAMFATAETGDKGQYLGGDPSWTIYDPQIIENLGLNFEIVYVGSETGILAALDAAYNREEPILFYFWTPHSAFNSYDLTNVKLPEYNDECYASADDWRSRLRLPGGRPLQDRQPRSEERRPRGGRLVAQHELRRSRPDLDAGCRRTRRCVDRGSSGGVDRGQRKYLAGLAALIQTPAGRGGPPAAPCME